jgi:hypothetical protein
VFEKLSDADMMRMANDVCAGMPYLAESGFVHRDLATQDKLIIRTLVMFLINNNHLIDFLLTCLV